MHVKLRETPRSIKLTQLGIGLVVVLLAYAPNIMATVGGTPAYQVESVPFEWIDASTGTTQDPQDTIPIGFNFQYYGETYSTLAVMTEGYLAMGMFEYSDSVRRIMPYLDYSMVRTQPSNRIYIKREGIAPNRRFTASWIDFSYLGAVICGEDYFCEGVYFGKVSFQVTLYEGSNDIVYRYLDVIASDEGNPDYPNYDNGRTATVLVENGRRNEGTLYSRNQAAIQNGTALRFFLGTPTNISPIANGGTPLWPQGPVQIVAPGSTVSLDGSNSSDSNGSIATYSWAQAYSQTIPLSNANTAVASFVAPTQEGAYYFDLTVTDNLRAHSIDRVTIYVRKTPPPNALPVANAGPDQTVKQKSNVSLNGSGSYDSDGSIGSYRWRQVAGKSVTLKNASSANPSFTAPSTTKNITLTFELTVTDNSGATASDQVGITVKP